MSAAQDVASEALRTFRLSTFQRGYWGHICTLPSPAPPTHTHRVYVRALQQAGRRPLSSVQLTEWMAAELEQG